MKRQVLLGFTMFLVGLVGGTIPARADFVMGPSAYAHLVDGYFTGFGTVAGYEWSDITPMPGRYSMFYVDYVAAFKTIYLMNDWTENTQGLLSTEFNEFTFSAQNISWDLKVFSDHSVLLSGPGTVTSAYGYGESPNLAANHTMWEVALDVSTVFPSDPVPPAFTGTECDPIIQNGACVPDPDIDGFNIVPNADGGANVSVIPEPGAILLLGTATIIMGTNILRRKLRRTAATRNSRAA